MAAASLLLDFGSLPRRQRNWVWLAFCHENYQALFGDQWQSMAREAMAALRMEAGRHPGDTSLQALVGELAVRDDDFRAWWGAAPVSAPKLRRKVYHHPLAGALTLDAHMLAEPDPRTAARAARDHRVRQVAACPGPRAVRSTARRAR